MYQIENEYGRFCIMTHENTDFTKSTFCYTSKIGFYSLEKMSIEKMCGIDEYILIFTVAGCGEVTIGDITFSAMPKSVLIIPPKTDYSYRTDKVCKEWVCYIVQIGGKPAEPVLNALHADGRLLFNIREGMDEIINIIIHIMSFDFAGEDDFEISSSIDLYRIVFLLYNTINAQASMRRECSQITAMIYRHIKQNYRKTVSLEELSKKFYISNSQLIRIFKDDIGLTPYNFLKKYRMDRAKELLRYTILSVREISSLVGFSNASNFIKQFKSLEDMTPDAYRNICLQKLLSERDGD